MADIFHEVDEEVRRERLQKLWERFGEACDYIPLRDLPETASLFSHYAPLEL